MKEPDLVSRSYGRCLAEGNLFFDRFYDYFLKSDPRIMPMFRNTDMEKQKKLLRAGINYAIMYTTDSGHSSSEMALSRIRKSHSQTNLNISPNLYPLWISSLIHAVKVTDPKFTPELDEAWQKVLSASVEYIKAGFLS